MVERAWSLFKAFKMVWAAEYAELDTSPWASRMPTSDIRALVSKGIVKGSIHPERQSFGFFFTRAYLHIR